MYERYNRYDEGKQSSIISPVFISDPKAIDIIFVVCILHNFLLNRNDSWRPNAAEKRIIKKDIDEVYERIKHSAWAAESQRPRRGEGDDREDYLGKRKHDWVMDEVLRHHPRRRLNE